MNKQLTFVKQKNTPLVYVIHKHDATSLHYDFRLEIGGVMPSWAIPKGPTLDNTLKRLAMQTTDHSMEYRNFEGVISEGKYGAGPVMIWDEGIYYPEIEVAKGVRERIEDREQGLVTMKEGLKKGELKFFLKGKKLQGSFALVKTKAMSAGRQGFGGPKAWLMIKHKDEFVKPNYSAHEYDFSAVSKKSLDDIRKVPS
ncbi:MAG TPA: DNA polymerase ligase N-terminal domain-containing protein [Patescibacteria group bacterium]|nr:DNA polymerase ligase N-terminal domain-containing protein [Patescibacteria group bacterium]